MEKEERLIDANALRNSVFGMTQIEWDGMAASLAWAHAYRSFMRHIEAAPAVDAVGVVRCKDCRYSRELSAEEKGEFANSVVICTTCGIAEVCNVPVWETDFCSYGKRKAEE